MTHKFVINSENVNSYGYRILSAGVDYSQYMRNPVVLFMHERDDDDNRGSEVIGRCLSIEKSGTDLIAEVEFDETDEFAKKISGKVERGFLRMASMSCDCIETSAEPEMLLPGQCYPTVTGCKLIELSIVDIGGNDDALKLSKGHIPANMQKLNFQPKKDMDLQKIILAGGFKSTTENEVVNEIAALKLAKDNADAKVAELSARIDARETSEATEIVDKAVKLGLIPEALKSVQLAAFKSDFDGQKVTLSKLIEEREASAQKDGKQTALGAVILGKQTQPTGETESFDYLQKKNPVELKRIRDEEPAKYAELSKEYAKGVRYKG